MRILFMGSPAFAIPTLIEIYRNYDICAVVTQPDRPAGRGRGMQESAVKKQALSLELPLLQPASLKGDDVYNEIASLDPDLIVVAAFGQILPAEILNLPVHGSINVHASLLPRWRGAAPIQASILAGDEETGVTIMKMDAGLDTGPILTQEATTISVSETGGELEQRLASLGAELLSLTIPAYLTGEVQPMPQDDSKSTYAPMLKKRDGKLDLQQGAAHLARQVRAFEPWPTTYFFWEELRIVIRAARPHPAQGKTLGNVIEIEGQPAITTTEGSLLLEKLQPAGKREMTARDFLNGSPDFIGASITG